MDLILIDTVLNILLSIVSLLLIAMFVLFYKNH